MSITNKSSAETTQISIRNCNSIDEAEISLRHGSLNIKYGPNGLGKSTLARALTLNAEDEPDLSELTPFKHQGKQSGPTPCVVGADGIRKVLTFDDDYVAGFVFLQDEVVKDSFEIFMNTPEYQEGIKQIDGLFASLKDTFATQTDFTEALRDFEELQSAFKVTQKGTVSRASKGFKALQVGGKLANIPQDLEGYESFLTGDDPAGWVSWQSKGQKQYLEASDNCPFCSRPKMNRDTVKRVAEEYNSSSVKSMSTLRAALSRIGAYFEDSHFRALEEITTLLDDPSPAQETQLVTISRHVESFLKKLNNIENISFHALKSTDIRTVEETLTALKIDLVDLPSLGSPATRKITELVNTNIDEILVKVNDIKAHLGRQNSEVRKLIEFNQKSINDFLRSAGYRYKVRIEATPDSYRMLLEHEDSEGHIQSAANHLSYGERNAFALVLFMHHARSSRPDLVILDDPVSSFDQTKKFAILHQLFRGKTTNLRGLTSLFLTHDIEPAIDMVRTGTAGKFDGAKPVVSFLRGRSNKISEIPVTRSDICTFSQVCEENILSSPDTVVKCIYLRRLHEVYGQYEPSYDLISSLLHLRPAPTRMLSGRKEEDLTDEDIRAATAEIRQLIPEFNYDELLTTLSNPHQTAERFRSTDVGYEKLQLFRMILKARPSLESDDDVLMKFVNETFHIENEYIMQLNPRRFDAVPEFVIQACEALVDANFDPIEIN